MFVPLSDSNTSLARSWCFAFELARCDAVGPHVLEHVHGSSLDRVERERLR